MRKTLSVLMLATAPVALSAAVHANEDSHWYGGFDLGLSSMPTTQFKHTGSGLSLDADEDRSMVGGLYIGKKFGKSRVELEYLIRSNKFDGFSGVNSFDIGSDDLVTATSQKNSTFMVNAWHTLASGTEWALLAGAGFGFSDIALNGVSFGTADAGRTSSMAPTMQLMAEFVHPVSPGLEFGLGYRIVRSSVRTFETTLGNLEHRAKHNEVFARLSWSFGGGGYKKAAPVAPAPVAAPAAKPVAKPAPAPVTARPAKPVTQPVEVEAAPLPKPFIVYFAFDKSDISSAAMTTISKAANAYREFKAIEIQASGHADRAGSDVYNEKLAQSRVDAVRDALVREGVPASKILLTSEGENAPAVNTEDGVRERQNRRVVITLVR